MDAFTIIFLIVAIIIGLVNYKNGKTWKKILNIQSWISFVFAILSFFFAKKYGIEPVFIFGSISLIEELISWLM